MWRHETDLVSLLTGLVFVALGTLYLVAEVADFAVDIRWAAPVALIALGLAGLVGSIARLGREQRRPSDGD